VVQSGQPTAIWSTDNFYVIKGTVSQEKKLKNMGQYNLWTDAEILKNHYTLLKGIVLL